MLSLLPIKTSFSTLYWIPIAELLGPGEVSDLSVSKFSTREKKKSLSQPPKKRGDNGLGFDTFKLERCLYFGQK